MMAGSPRHAFAEQGWIQHRIDILGLTCGRMSVYERHHLALYRFTLFSPFKGLPFITINLLKKEGIIK